MEDEKEDQSIRDVIGTEKRRGVKRRPVDVEQKRKESLFASNALRAIEFKDERAFAEMLRMAGIRDGSPEYARAWKIFRFGGSLS
jgi:hypothetical protein